MKRYTCGHEILFELEDYHGLDVTSLEKRETKEYDIYIKDFNSLCPRCCEYNEKHKTAAELGKQYQLPVLRGTQAQIKYADVIRAEFVKDFLEEKPKHEKKLKKFVKDGEQFDSYRYEFSIYLLAEKHLYDNELFAKGLNKAPYIYASFWIEEIKGYKHFKRKYFFYYVAIDILLAGQDSDADVWDTLKAIRRRNDNETSLHND